MELIYSLMNKSLYYSCLHGDYKGHSKGRLGGPVVTLNLYIRPRIGREENTGSARMSAGLFAPVAETGLATD